MECSGAYTNIKQESNVQGFAVTAQSSAPRFSTSVTTGQGTAYAQPWMGSAPVSSTRLGNSRAPMPTCGIPAHRAHTNIMMIAPSGEGDIKPASAQVADTILGNVDVRAPLVAPKSSTGPGSLESVHEVACLRPGSEDNSPQRSDASELGSDDQDLGQESDEGSRQLVLAPRTTKSRKSKEKKKVGRPLAYKGDPNAPELTESERRRIKRRIANRESARRVRHKRQEVLEDMQVKMEQLHAHNVQLAHHAQEAEAQRSQFYNQLMDLEGKHKATMEENSKMQQEIHALRKSLQMKMSALEDELDRRAQELDNPPHVSAFGAASMQQPPSRLPNPMSSGCLIDTEGACKASLEWFPSLNLDDIPHRAEALDMLNTFLREDNQQARGEAVC